MLLTIYSASQPTSSRYLSAPIQHQAQWSVCFVQSTALGSPTYLSNLSGSCYLDVSVHLLLLRNSAVVRLYLPFTSLSLLVENPPSLLLSLYHMLVDLPALMPLAYLTSTNDASANLQLPSRPSPITF
jgi:hypothetical protein